MPKPNASIVSPKSLAALVSSSALFPQGQLNPLRFSPAAAVQCNVELSRTHPFPNRNARLQLSQYPARIERIPIRQGLKEH